MKTLKNNDQFVLEKGTFTVIKELWSKHQILDSLMSITNFKIQPTQFESFQWQLSIKLEFETQKRLNRLQNLPILSMVFSQEEGEKEIGVGKIFYDRDDNGMTIEGPKCFFITQLEMKSNGLNPSLLVPSTLVEAIRILDRPIKLLDIDETRDEKSLQLIKSGVVPIFVHNPSKESYKSTFPKY